MNQLKIHPALCIILLSLPLCNCARYQVSETTDKTEAEEPAAASEKTAPAAASTDLLDELDRLDLAASENEYDQPRVPDWKERSFLGNTHYSFETIDDSQIIKGETDGKASLLYRQQSIDLLRSPWMSWRWKINNTYGDLNEKVRDGDDFPARVYVVVQTGLLPWETVAINYVWSSNASIGATWDNPFTDKAKMVVLRSGGKEVGTWVQEKRNIAEDFRTFFNMNITKLSGYAVMVDGDNSSNRGIAWFTDIRFDAD